MLSTKTRTTFVALIATCSVAFVAAPLASVAGGKPNNHAYAKTVRRRNGPWHNTCANAQISFENAITLTEYDAGQGDFKNAEKDLDLATTIHDNAKASGCSVS
jgi:hypothetical protein